MLALQGCFTGVESTPKITYKDVRSNHASVSTEQRMAGRLVPSPFGEWGSGKQFRVSSDRIRLAFQPLSIARHAPAEGDTLTYVGHREVAAVAGGTVVELLFTNANAAESDTAAYRTNTDMATLKERRQVELPFAVDLELVGQIRQELAGKELWLRVPLRYDRWGRSSQGRKFIRVEIVDVDAMNDIYPARVHFREADSGKDAYLYMSVPDSRGASPRGFDTLFSLTDPRKAYPAVSDANWSAIMQSRPLKGMTRDEVLLAVGSPQMVDRAHNQSSAYERWGYADGSSLLLEDGVVVQIR